MALPAPPDVNDWASTIMRRLSGGNMGLFAGFDPTPYEQQLTGAYQSAAQQLSGLDQAEAIARANNDLQIGNVGTARDQALRTLRERMAGQGLTDSSINLDEQSRTNTGYDQQIQNLNAALSGNLADIVAKRLGVEGGYQGTLGNVGISMSGAGSNYLQQQASQLAQAQANQQLLAQQQRESDIAQANMATLIKAQSPQIISTPPQAAPPPIAPPTPYTPPPINAAGTAVPAAPKPPTGMPPVSNYNPIGKAPQPVRQVPVKGVSSGGVQSGRGNVAV